MHSYHTSLSSDEKGTKTRMKIVFFTDNVHVLPFLSNLDHVMMASKNKSTQSTPLYLRNRIRLNVHVQVSGLQDGSKKEEEDALPHKSYNMSPFKNTISCVFIAFYYVCLLFTDKKSTKCSILGSESGMEWENERMRGRRRRRIWWGLTLVSQEKRKSVWTDGLPLLFIRANTHFDDDSIILSFLTLHIKVC